jgi:DNA repair/transcription protein MET18/MMS19
MKRVFDFWGGWLNDATTTSPLDPDTFRTYNTIAMNVIAGAAARQDKHVLALIPALHQIAATPHPNGEILAQSLGLIVKQNDLLTPSNHAVVKRFYKQWAYTHLAKPLIQSAQPTASEEDNNHMATTAIRHRLAVLSVVGNCPFTVYQDDLPQLLRLLITALTGRAGISFPGVAWAQTVSALEVLAEVLAHEPEAVRGYLREVVGGTTAVYRECARGKKNNEDERREMVVCRRLALQVLGAIPGRFEERHLLAYAPATQRMLAVACGDGVRKVREVARRARAAWAKIVV